MAYTITTYTYTHVSPAAIIIAVFIAVVFFAALLRHLCCPRPMTAAEEEHKHALTSYAGCAPPEVYHCGARRPAGSTMEVRVGPFVWAFRRADGWRSRSSFSVFRSDNGVVHGDFV